MAFSDSQIRALKATDRRQKKSCGESRFLIVEPASKGGGKSFFGRFRFPPGRQGRELEIRIGPYGKGPGKWSLKSAREEWERLRAWSREHNRDPRELKKEEKKGPIQVSTGPTLSEVCDSYCHKSKNKTIEEYRRILFGDALPILNGDLPVEHFSWDYKQRMGKTGRELVMDYYEAIDSRAPVQADKVLMVLRNVFNHAIDKGWLERNQNPALNPLSKKPKAPAVPHPTLPWDQLPKFFAALEKNEGNASVVMLCAVKVVFMTFLRVGSMAPMRWDELDEKKNLWTIPADRMKTKKTHLVPMTNQLWEVFDSLRTVNGDNEFVFASPRRKEQGHMNPYSINQHFIRMGYKGMQTAHGLRRTALTAGQDVLRLPAEVIQRQMAHAVGDKIRQAYYHSTMLDECREFMIKWCDALVEQGLIT